VRLARLPGRVPGVRLGPSSSAGGDGAAPAALGRVTVGALRLDHVEALAGELVAPPAVRRALARGLELLDAGMGGRGLEPATVREARALARGATCTRAKAEKAGRWFVRNARFARAPTTSPAGVAWLLWGGAAGRAWFKRVLRSYRGS